MENKLTSLEVFPISQTSNIIKDLNDNHSESFYCAIKNYDEKYILGIVLDEESEKKSKGYDDKDIILLCNYSPQILRVSGNFIIFNSIKELKDYVINEIEKEYRFENRKYCPLHLKEIE